MPHNQNCENMDFSRFDNMSDEELQKFLQDDMNKPEGQDSNYEMLLHIMEVLAKRKETRNEFSKTPDEAFVSFKQHYLPLKEEEDASKAVFEVKTLPWWLRRSLSVAAVLAVVVFGFMTTSASGFNVWTIVGKWAQETFHFGTYAETEDSEPNATNTTEFESLQAALDYYEITVPLAPTRLPAGYELINIQVDQTPQQDYFLAVYQSGEKQLQISIRRFFSEAPLQIEQSGAAIETYIVDGVEYYIFMNNNLIQTAWLVDSYECFMSGECSIEEIKSMIHSIGERY